MFSVTAGDLLTVSATATGETAGTASQWTFGTAVIWAILVACVLYVLYRRFDTGGPNC